MLTASDTTSEVTPMMKIDANMLPSSANGFRSLGSSSTSSLSTALYANPSPTLSKRAGSSAYGGCTPVPGSCA
jgi:hypothetical protein